MVWQKRAVSGRRDSVATDWYGVAIRDGRRGLPGFIGRVHVLVLDKGLSWTYVLIMQTATKSACLTSIALSNNFHATSITVHIPLSGIVTRRTVSTWRARLCGSESCTCSGIDGQRGPLAIDTLDNYDGTATVRVIK